MDDKKVTYPDLVQAIAEIVRLRVLDFDSRHFASNPIGVIFEPEALISRYRGGAFLDTLLARPVIDPADLINHLPLPPSG